MFRKILIANRGEIAVTVIRACRDMGILTVAVFSEADRDALHVHLADEAICIGPASSTDSYLNAQAILSACLVSGAEAIHPGFGFLSENSAFVRMCQKIGVTFIGPDSQTMQLMGDKATAKKTALNAQVPVVPGSRDLPENVSDALKAAQDIGFPVMIKATAGGGGRGMRVAETAEELPRAYLSARQEARACFGNDRVYLERFIQNPHHVEVQILGDRFGNVIHLGDRDCSIQRRNQKMLEEARSPFISERTREAMYETSLRLAKSVQYVGAGTLGCLGDVEGRFYVMEMKTRIKVEHPSSEAVTSVNIVQEQIRVAAGEPLSIRQKDIQFSGHAIECRINAEDPLQNFRPAPGKISELLLPGGNGIRIDSAIYQGYEVPPYYDSLLAKLIVWAPDRATAISRMRRALTEFSIVGVPTTIDFHLAILRDPEFIRGNYDIAYLTRKMPQFLAALREQ